MDKIISARIDEAVAKRIDYVAKLKKTSKKQVLEEAISEYVEKVEKEKKQDVFEKTFGAWQRDLPVEKEIKQIRSTFNQSMQRRQK